MSSDALMQALREESQRLVERQRELRAQMEATDQELREVNVRLSHVQALLNHSELSDAHPHAVTSSVSRNPESGSGNVANPDSSDAIEIAHSVILERGGEPIHYKELTELVIQRGGLLPNRDPAGTLVSRLVRDDRFVRPLRRGFYALKIHYPRARNVGSREPKHVVGRGLRQNGRSGKNGSSSATPEQ